MEAHVSQPPWGVNVTVNLAGGDSFVKQVCCEIAYLTRNVLKEKFGEILNILHNALKSITL